MIIETFILLLAIPLGYLIAWLARDELLAGRKWFLILLFISLILMPIFYFFGKIYISLTAFFIFIVSFISLIKSQDRRWIRKI